MIQAMEIVTYRLPAGTSLGVAPEMGCNIASWVVAGKDVFYRHPDFGSDPEKFFHGGNPVLFPCVGRTWDRSGPIPRFGIYRVHGADGEYSMPLHGLMRRARCVKVSEDVTSDLVSVGYDVTFPEDARREAYPFELTLRLAYLCQGASLRITATVTNNGDTIAPFALGYHPWFAVADQRRRGTEVRMPATVELTTIPELAIPDGGQKPFAGMLRFPAEGSVGGVYAGLRSGRATLVDRLSRRMIHIDVDRSISNFVIAAPNGLSAVCVEPWSSGLGGWESLKQPDWREKTSLVLLNPGQTKHFVVTYTVEMSAAERPACATGPKDGSGCDPSPVFGVLSRGCG